MKFGDGDRINTATVVCSTSSSMASVIKTPTTGATGVTNTNSTPLTTIGCSATVTVSGASTNYNLNDGRSNSSARNTTRLSSDAVKVPPHIASAATGTDVTTTSTVVTQQSSPHAPLLSAPGFEKAKETEDTSPSTAPAAVTGVKSNIDCKATDSTVASP